MNLPNDYFISRIGDFASSRRIKLGANPGHKLLEVSETARLFSKFVSARLRPGELAAMYGPPSDCKGKVGG